jgi:hypothetical protein
METNRCKKYWKISVRIGPLFQAPIKGPTSNEFDKIVMQPSLHRDLQIQCQFESCGNRHVLKTFLFFYNIFKFYITSITSNYYSNKYSIFHGLPNI